MTASGNRHFSLALVSSGLGRVSRGVETWMRQLAFYLPEHLDVELWSGGPPPCLVNRTARCLHALSRDAPTLKPFSWHSRYLIEQLSALPATVFLLRKREIGIAYCGDPALSWHLRTLEPLHGARVVFMNGMRLSPSWARRFDGVHLLAPFYLEEARDELGHEGSNHFFVAPHFADVGRFCPADEPQRREAREKLGLAQDAFVILNVGPVGEVSGKRLEFLIEAVSLLDADCTLVSAGVDEDGASSVRALGHRLLADRARFLGPVQLESMPALYQAADIYAIAALQEPFSIAILEALASGIPVIYAPDEIRNWQVGAGGVGVSMTDRSAAVAVLRKLKADPVWRRQLGSQGRALAESRYRPDIVCKQLCHALEGIWHRSTGGS